MSSIVFSFDAEAVGVLAALDAIRGGIEDIISVAERLSTSFGQINASAEQLNLGMTSLFTNFSAITAASEGSSASMGRSANAAKNLAYHLQQLSQRSSDMAEAHTDAVAKIEQQEQRLSETTQDQIARRNDAYVRSMDKLVESHQQALQAISDQEKNVSESYLDTMDSRLIKLQNPVALQHQQLVKSLEMQISGMLTMGNIQGARTLEARLNNENQQYHTFLTTKIAPYYQDLDAKGYRHHQNQLEALAKRLTKETDQYADQATQLQRQRDQQLADIRKHYNQQETDLQTHLNAENDKYARQQRDIAQQQARAFDTSTAGGGGRGGGGASSSQGKAPAPANGIDLFKQLGIDPQKSPEDATAAVNAWIMGTAYKGRAIGNGRGQAFNTQMTLPQVQSVTMQALALGQDPTLNVRGNENYVDLFANLLAFTKSTAPTRSDASRFNSLEQIMEKVMSGNTQGLTRQFATLGLSKNLLEQSGIKFGGPSGNTIENSGDVLGALQTLSHTAAPGLGKKAGTETFAGLMNQYKDLWYRTAQEIGDSSNPKGLWKQMDVQVARLLDFLFGHQADFVQFGQSIFTGVINAFSRFNDFISSKQGADTLKAIGNAFHEIGNALKWIGSHKDIILLLISLLGMQASAKLLGGMAGGAMNAVGGLMSGGIVGAGQSLLGGLGPRLGMPQGQAGYAGMVDEATAAKAVADKSFHYSRAADDAVTRVGIPQSVADAAKSRFTADYHNFEILDMVAKDAAPGPARGLVARAIGMGAALNPINAIGGVIGGGQAIGGLARGGVMAAAGGFTAGGGGIAGIVGAATSIGPFLVAMGPAIAGIAAAAAPIILVAGAIAGLIAALVMNRDKIMPFINTLMRFFTVQLKDALKAVQTFGAEVQARMGGTFGPGSFVHGILMFFAAFWTGAWGGIQMAFRGVWDVIVGFIKIAWAIFSGIILIGMDLLGGKWGRAWHDFQMMLWGIWFGIQSIVGGVIGVIGGIIIGFFGGLWNAVTGHLSGFGVNIGKWIRDIGDGIVNFFTRTIPQGIAGAFRGIGATVKASVNWIVDNVLPGPLQGPVHAALGFAEGGQYPGGEVAVVGEKGPELFFNKYQGTVVPNSQIRDVLGVGKGTGNQGGRAIMITGPVHIHTNNAEDLYKQLNQFAGKRAEFGVRGSSL